MFVEEGSLINRRILAGVGGLVVLYCLTALAMIATVPDPRLRFLLIDAVESFHLPFHVSVSSEPGIVIRRATGLKQFGEPLRAGDRLLEFAGKPVHDYIDYARLLFALRSAEIPPGGNVLAGTDLLQPGLPAIVQEEAAHRRWVRARIRRGTSDFDCMVALQSVPLQDVALTFVWFILELVITVVGALAFWSRPFDRPAELFFAMCLTTLGAFIGGFHWWVIVGSLWLTIPFMLCSILLPVVTFHFFLMFPRPKPLIVWRPRTMLLATYLVPALTIGMFLVAEIALWRWVVQPDSEMRTAAVRGWLQGIRQGIYLYLAIAAVYFLATLVSLIYSRFTTRNPLELNQVNSILWAGFIATIFIGYTLLLAYFNRIAFALGGGRLPMFLASLVFMLAYAVGIVRFKLMLIDQMISRGMWYYIWSYGSTALVAGGIAAGAWGISLQTQLLPSAFQATLVAAVMMTGVVLVLWLRDGWQRAIDRRFFREKYRLDKALQRMNRAAGQVTDSQFLAERMLTSCREVLQADRAALYLRVDKSSTWRLTCAQGNSPRLPLQFPVTDEFLHDLGREGTLQRDLTASAGSPPEQAVLRQLHAELIHGLEHDGAITGFVALGPKRGSGVYSAEDLTFLTALGQITSVALHSAKMHQDLGHLNDELQLKVERIAQQKQQILMLQAELTATQPASAPAPPSEEFQRELIAGNSPALIRVIETVRKVAASETSVLLRGESGTGKELLAKAIHENSPRRSGPMIAVHCGALSAGLLESELFGHVKGSFTGAHADRRGRFELAAGGTIFLDEIGDISAETQIKLLRVLQQREFERVGGMETIRVDVRIIAATHQNLEQLIAQGKFREDLYYRLNVVSITLPPLRERREDLLELSMLFLKRATARGDKQIVGIDDDAVDALVRYGWPGNIRELENVIERAVVLADGPQIALGDLPADLLTPGKIVRSAAAPKAGVRSQRTIDRTPLPEVESSPWRKLDQQTERDLLLNALQQCHGNKARAARMLGLPRSTFLSKLKKFAIAE